MNWMPRGADRRASVRFDVAGPLRGTAVCSQYVHVCNVGPNGAFIESLWLLPIEAQVSLKLSPGALEDQIDARVRHIANLPAGGHLIGLEFIGHHAALAERLGSLPPKAD